jgi:protein phosphatase
VVLVGAAGAGKSTLAARFFAGDEIVSSDELRAAVRGDPADQSATRTAFAILHRELTRRLSVGRLVVVDATNLTRAARAAILRRAITAQAPAIAIVLAPPDALVRARNATRQGAIVPAEVVDRHLAAVARLGRQPTVIVDALIAEGFAAAHVLGSSDDLERLEIVRPTRLR